MRASVFNISVPATDDTRVVLFNTLRGSLSVCDPEELPLVNRFLSEGVFEPVSKEQESFLNRMLELGYAVDDRCDEMEIVRNRKRAGMCDPNRLDIIVLPNMNCNFACPYCYEAHQAGSAMSSEVERRIIAFFEAQIPRFRVLLLSWFGGEPLLNFETVVAVSTAAQDICRRHNVALVGNVTTNGYLVDEQRARILVERGIHNYQITVDGPPEVHNRTRRLRGGGGTFDRVFESITILARTDPRVHVSLRVNFNHQNIDSIPHLLELFDPIVRPSLRVVFEPVFGDHCLSATKNIEAREISDKLFRYYALARELGYDVTQGGLPIGQLVYCYAERENQFIFNHAGDLYKCSVSRFAAEERFGYLNSQGEIVREDGRWQAWFGMDLFDEKCYSCKYLPLCMGGCRRARVEGDATGSYCKLVPTNVSFALKTVAFGSFRELLIANGTEESMSFNTDADSDKELSQ
jgi:uncharacterized protein